MDSSIKRGDIVLLKSRKHLKRYSNSFVTIARVLEYTDQIITKGSLEVIDILDIERKATKDEIEQITNTINK